MGNDVRSGLRKGVWNGARCGVKKGARNGVVNRVRNGVRRSLLDCLRNGVLEQGAELCGLVYMERRVEGSQERNAEQCVEQFL